MFKILLVQHTINKAAIRQEAHLPGDPGLKLPAGAARPTILTIWTDQSSGLAVSPGEVAICPWDGCFRAWLYRLLLQCPSAGSLIAVCMLKIRM